MSRATIHVVSAELYLGRYTKLCTSLPKAMVKENISTLDVCAGGLEKCALWLVPCQPLFMAQKTSAIQMRRVLTTHALILFIGDNARANNNAHYMNNPRQHDNRDGSMSTSILYPDCTSALPGAVPVITPKCVRSKLHPIFVPHPK